jgi:hypothetical protein
MFDQLSAEIPASLIKGFPTTTRTRTRTTTTKQNVDPAVHFVYSRVKIVIWCVEKGTIRRLTVFNYMSISALGKLVFFSG